MDYPWGYPWKFMVHKSIVPFNSPLPKKYSQLNQTVPNYTTYSVSFSLYTQSFFCHLAARSLLILWLPTGSLADTELKFQWDPNPEPDIAGYSVFSRLEGQEYDYHQPDWDGQDTECTIYVEDVETPHYFVVRAYDLDGFESADSNEVRYPDDDLNRNLGAGTGGSEVGCFIDAVSEILIQWAIKI